MGERTGFGRFGNFVADMQRVLADAYATVSILHNVSETRRNKKVGAACGPSVRPVRVPGGVQGRSRRGFPSASRPYCHLCPVPFLGTSCKFWKLVVPR